MKQKAGFSKRKINTINKTLSRLTKMKREKTQITSIRNETRDITTDPVAIERIMRGCYEHFYTYTFDNLELDQFLKIQTTKTQAR